MFINQVQAPGFNSINNLKKVQISPDETQSSENQAPAFKGKFSAVKNAATDTFVKNANKETLLSKLRGKTTAKILAAIMALSTGATMLQSCTDEPEDIYINYRSNTNQSVNVDLSGLADILAPYLQTIINNQNTTNARLEALETIIQYLKENNYNQSVLIALLQAQGLQNDEIISLLRHIDDDQHTLIDAVTNGFSQVTAAVVANGDRIDKLAANLKVIFNRFLKLLQNIDKTTNHMDNDLHNIDANVAAALDKLLSGEMSEQEMNMWLELFDRMDQHDQLESNMWNNLFVNMAKYDTNRRNEAIGYMMLLTNINNSVDSLKTNPQQVDLTGLENRLDSLNQKQDITNSLLTTNNDRLAVIKIVVDGISSYVAHMDNDIHGLKEKLKDDLEAILNKIPNGCQCSPTDLTQVINLLQQLLTALQNGDTNEGVIIVGDINDILG